MLGFLMELVEKIYIFKFRRYVYSQMKAGMHVGKNVMITPGAIFDPPHSFLTSIGDNCIIAPEVRFLNHDASLFGFEKFARIGRIDIYENCFIGARTVILPGVKIGPNSVVAAGSVVVKDIPPNTIAGGNPAKPIKALDEFIADNKSKLEKGEIPGFRSEEFYSSIYSTEYVENVREQLKNSFGYTIGSDNDKTYHFNIDG